MLAVLVDRANPIVVKETRQALKSRQFVITFLVVLLACWIASFAVVASIGPQIRYEAHGPTLFMWFYGILNAATFVIAPYTAFRSLASEREDNTFDLLSISNLSSRQIISGKLWSAVLQIAIYFSAAAPFIAFTFLLRGIEVVDVAALLLLSAGTSLLLSVFGLLAGSLANVRNTQALVSLALLLALVGTFGASLGIAALMMLEDEISFSDPQLPAIAVFLLVIGSTTFAILHAAAAAQLAFSSENRSTSVRVRLALQQTCILACIGAALFADSGSPVRHVRFLCSLFAVAAGMHWFLVGSLATGEWPHLSRRVQRSLPTAPLERALFSWFYPGPGAGYMFATSCLTACLALFGGVLLFVTGFTSDYREAYILALTWSYVVGYLGWGRLAINAMRRYFYVPLTAAFLLNLILVLLGVAVPLVFDALATRRQFMAEYSLQHVANPFWTLERLINSGAAVIDGPIALTVVGTLALAAFLLNLRSVGAELQRQRVAAPQRVKDDELELANQSRSLGPTNPWEAEESS
ncbi:MAG: hypothetical protein KDA61_09960 [Planctomycetales bacterium]|nr:hypothetical protein [Planctomycetales bacterium]